MWQLLRIGSSGCFLLLSVAFFALWIQSYQTKVWLDTGRNPIPRGPFLISSKGVVELGIRKIIAPTKSNPFPKLEPWTVDLYLLQLTDSKPPGRWGFHAQFGKVWKASAPHWFLMIVSGLASLCFKPKPRSKFSLREFLLFATLAACSLAVAFSVVRYEDF